MKIHEYQAKEILKKYNVPVPDGIASTTVEGAVEAAKELEANGATLFVVKAQIHAGGRGKDEPKRITQKGLSSVNLLMK